MSSSTARRISGIQGNEALFNAIVPQSNKIAAAGEHNPKLTFKQRYGTHFSRVFEQLSEEIIFRASNMR